VFLEADNMFTSWLVLTIYNKKEKKGMFF